MTEQTAADNKFEEVYEIEGIYNIIYIYLNIYRAWEFLGKFWGIFGKVLGDFHFAGDLWSIWGRFWGIFGRFWGIFGRFFRRFFGPFFSTVFEVHF